jgi:PAS domain S-box-containing protein
LAARDGGARSATISAARLSSDADCPSVAIVRADEGVPPEAQEAIVAAAKLLDSLPDPVVIIDGSRFIAHVNPAFERVFGYRAPEVVDRPLAVLARSSADIDRIAAALCPDSPTRDEDLGVQRRDGSKVWVHLSASVLRLPGGEEAGAVAYLRDVTQRHVAQESLARKNAELEHYVHAVSHDLRSPLVSLLGFSRLLRDDYGDTLDEKGLHFLDRIEQAGRTMESLIHDLLELSRIGCSGSADTEVDPRTVLLQLQAEFKQRLDDRGLRLDIPEDPPPLRCDRTRLYQVFANLISNALEHAGTCREPVIRVEIERTGNEHVLRVCDTGRGVAPEDAERIFEIFQSLGQRDGGRRGTGIGLAIVRKIAETQQGRCWVEPTLAGGATFAVALPV